MKILNQTARHDLHGPTLPSTLSHCSLCPVSLPFFSFCGKPGLSPNLALMIVSAWKPPIRSSHKFLLHHLGSEAFPDHQKTKVSQLLSFPITLLRFSPCCPVPHKTLFTRVSLLNVAVAPQEHNLLEVRDFIMLLSMLCARQGSWPEEVLTS